MKSYKSYSNSAYLRKEDFQTPENLTIAAAREEQITVPGEQAKRKLVLYFEEIEKGLVMNIANGNALFEMTGQEDPEKWIGQSVEVYTDPHVTYAGKRIRGIRLRKPAPAASNGQVPASQTAK
jgi:hypothetical protein